MSYFGHRHEQHLSWAGLAVASIAGFTIGTAFTMSVVPVLYATFYPISAARPLQDPLRSGQAEPATNG